MAHARLARPAHPASADAYVSPSGAFRAWVNVAVLRWCYVLFVGPVVVLCCVVVGMCVGVRRSGGVGQSGFVFGGEVVECLAAVSGE